MFNHKSTIPFGVIGLGRFGFALATTLADLGKEVMVLDNNENKVKAIQERVEHALVVPHLDKASLEEAGIQNCETVIVCIGEHIEVSILTVLNVIELGVPRVIAKAISAEHGKVLQKIGAEVVYPERDRAIRLANTLATSRALDHIDLSDQFSIWEIKLTKNFKGKTVLDVNFRKRFGLNIIAIVRNGETIVEITPEIVLNEDDIVVVVGKKDNINKFDQVLGQS